MLALIAAAALSSSGGATVPEFRVSKARCVSTRLGEGPYWDESVLELFGPPGVPSPGGLREGGWSVTFAFHDSGGPSAWGGPKYHAVMDPILPGEELYVIVTWEPGARPVVVPARFAQQHLLPRYADLVHVLNPRDTARARQHPSGDETDQLARMVDHALSRKNRSDLLKGVKELRVLKSRIADEYVRWLSDRLSGVDLAPPSGTRAGRVASER